MALTRFLSSSSLLLPLLLLLESVSGGNQTIIKTRFTVQEATIDDIREAFKEKRLTSRQLVEFYIEAIQELNPTLHGVIETNPDAITDAERADRERETKSKDDLSLLPVLHGIPVLLKDSIGTKDKLNTTAGSWALLGSVVARDATVVKKLREAGAVILGKASLSEWANFRSLSIPSGWSARGGQGKNPYVLSASPCGSSSGSAISVAANMVAVTLGTETDGSILCPANQNSVVGIKPTVGLTSRVVPISPRQDTIGPICRTVSDAVHLLDVIVGEDDMDKATKKASKHIPEGGYKSFLDPYGLRGKRLGIVRKPFLHSSSDAILVEALDRHVETLRREGAIVIDNLEIPNIEVILDYFQSGEAIVVLAEFKASLNEYLEELVDSPVRSLKDVIAFNEKFSKLEKTEQWGQDNFIAAEATNGIGETEKALISKLEKLSRNGIEKLMKENRLDAMVTVGSDVSPVLAIGGYPGINVPAGYDREGVPFGISFGGLRFSEPNLIEIAYGFEQATMVRKPPQFTA
ncbi:PREDICTED: putative amidase C869.01 [Tarenaya hassleriana]|uniref:putative amidase C869.01 n=1 Tax=Tarenaya hassleriana TaxID=28532 RepID=UPI00053C9688|nr:PREDICTED: putative amidase C869.01 [Tarenaya hassleriana]